MDTPALYCIYVPDGGDDPVECTDDYDEAVALCRELVADEGYARAEVRCGRRTCCIIDWDPAGRVRVWDDGPGEEDVTRRLRAGGVMDRGRPVTRLTTPADVMPAPPGAPDLEPTPPSATARSSGRPGQRERAVEIERPRFLGVDQGAPPTCWLGL